MGRSLKVYTTQSFRDGKQVCVVFAATSWRQFAKALGQTLYSVKLYGWVTMNPAYARVARAKPFTLFTRPLLGVDEQLEEWDGKA